MSVNIHLTNVEQVATANDTANAYFIDVIGNKLDAANTTTNEASIMGLLRYIVANISTDADVAALIGALDTAAATGAVSDAKVLMAYIKQLVTALNTVKGDLDNGGRLDLLIDAILADTNELQTDWTNGGRLDLLIDAIKAVTDALPDAGALTSIAQESTLGTPTGASISADISAIGTILGVPTDTDLATDIDNIATDVSSISTAVVTTIPALIGTPVADLAADIAAIKAVVDAILILVTP